MIAVFHVLQLRDSTQPDAEIFSHNAGTALSGVSGCHLYRAHQAAALHWCTDVCMPAEQQGAYTGVATGATMANEMPRCKLIALNTTFALAKCTLFLALHHANIHSLPLTGCLQEMSSQATEILSNSLPMALPAALFVMQQVLQRLVTLRCHTQPHAYPPLLPVIMLSELVLCHYLHLWHSY